MSQMHSDPDEADVDDLEQLLTQGVSLEEPSTPPTQENAKKTGVFYGGSEENEEGGEGSKNSDLQGAIGLFAEAAQDMATAGVELGLGRHFACADFCNQAAEKATQAVSLLYFGRRSPYDHDLEALGKLVHAPQPVLDDLATLTPFHPEAFYADTPPEDADDIISGEQAVQYVGSARRIVRWARGIILSA